MTLSTGKWRTSHCRLAKKHAECVFSLRFRDHVALPLYNERNQIVGVGHGHYDRGDLLSAAFGWVLDCS